MLLHTLRVWLVVKLIIQISKGIIRDQRTRRAAMFHGVLVALIMLFIGAVVIERWLAEHIWFFIIWWGGCAWLTLLSVLLAFFDMLVVRAAARRERRRLENRFLRRPPEEAGHDDAP